MGVGRILSTGAKIFLGGTREIKNGCGGCGASPNGTKKHPHAEWEGGARASFLQLHVGKKFGGRGMARCHSGKKKKSGWWGQFGLTWGKILNKVVSGKPVIQGPLGA